MNGIILRKIRLVPTMVALVAVIATSAGCGTGAPRTLIGVRKVSLAMAFKDDALTPPAPTKVVLKVVPASPELIQQFVPDYQLPPRPLPALPPLDQKAFVLCPKAPPGASPDLPVGVAIKQPPKEGLYYTQNTGTVRVEGGVIPLTLPYPPFSTFRVSNVKQHEESNIYSGTVKITEFETEVALTPSLKIHSY